MNARSPPRTQLKIHFASISLDVPFPWCTGFAVDEVHCRKYRTESNLGCHWWRAGTSCHGRIHLTTRCALNFRWSWEKSNFWWLVLLVVFYLKWKMRLLRYSVEWYRTQTYRFDDFLFAAMFLSYPKDVRSMWHMHLMRKIEIRIFGQRWINVEVVEDIFVSKGE